MEPYVGLYIVGYMADDGLMVTLAVFTLGNYRLTERAGGALKLLSGVVMLVLAPFSRCGRAGCCDGGAAMTATDHPTPPGALRGWVGVPPKTDHSAAEFFNGFNVGVHPRATAAGWRTLGATTGLTTLC